jgi:aspartate dehydrogenase
LKNILLIGCGAMGRSVLHQLHGDQRVRVRDVMTIASQREELQRELGDAFRVVCSLDELQELPDFALECAGHEALKTSVPALLRLGVDTIVASVGALAERGLPELLERAATEGNSQLTLVPGAVAGIDALAAARLHGITSVKYTGRKPPLGWIGTPAEEKHDLSKLTEAAVIFEGSARAAASLYPKNANVAAMIALAGIGMDNTQVRLIADPRVTRNTHTLNAAGAFGDLEMTVANIPLADNPKTSALAALSIVRAVRNRVDPVII